MNKIRDIKIEIRGEGGEFIGMEFQLRNIVSKTPGEVIRATATTLLENLTDDMKNSRDQLFLWKDEEEHQKQKHNSESNPEDINDDASGDNNPFLDKGNWFYLKAESFRKLVFDNMNYLRDSPENTQSEVKQKWFKIFKEELDIPELTTDEIAETF